MLQNANFWLAVSMIIFFAIVWRPGRRALIKGLDARRDALKMELEKARALRLEAEALLESSQRQQNEALQTAAAIVAEAQADAVRLRQDAARAMHEALAARETAALAKIAEAEANATREARAMAAELALAASREWLKQRLTAEAATRLVDEAIAQIKPERLN